jgi:hypothetical protein
LQLCLLFSCWSFSRDMDALLMSPPDRPIVSVLYEYSFNYSSEVYFAGNRPLGAVIPPNPTQSSSILPPGCIPATLSPRICTTPVCTGSSRPVLPTQFRLGDVEKACDFHIEFHQLLLEDYHQSERRGRRGRELRCRLREGGDYFLISSSIC